MSQRNDVFRIRSGYMILFWFMLLLPLVSTLALAIFLTVNTQRYFDLDTVLFLGLLIGYFWVIWAALSYQQTSHVQLPNDSFTFKKVGQKPARYPYSAILAHNERLESGRGGPFNELTVYLADNWFAIRSNQFRDYDYLKDYLTQYGQPVSYRNVITPAERSRIGYFISGLALLIVITIALSFVAHNPADPNPARLISLIDTVDRVRENRHKSRLTGVTISLRPFPGFAFYVSRRNYDVRLAGLEAAITPKRPISLLIRESDFRKKLRKTEPLTFGDKYDNYYQIMVFGVTQGDAVRLQTPNLVYEPTHTNPYQRAFLLSILLLLCWTGWVYVDRQEVLRPS